MSIQISKPGLAMAASAFAFCLAAASPSLALRAPGGDGEDPGCMGQENGCPHDPPPNVLPHTPAPLGSDGRSTIYAGGAYNEQYVTAAGPVNVSRASDAGSIVMSTSTSPIASAMGQVVATDPNRFTSGDLGLGYSVIVSANSQAAADGLSAWFAAGHEIASLHGTYATAFTDQGQAQAALTTGFNIPGDVTHSFGTVCSYYQGPCSNGAFDLGVALVSASNTFSNGNPFDFYGSVFMSIHVRAGAVGLSARTGTASAYIDPFISLNFGGSGLNANDYTLTLGDGSVANASADGFTGAAGGVPEPASWTLMIAGFGLAGAALRRRRMVAA